MKIVKIIVALVLTLAMLYVARNNSRGRPEYFEHQENGYTFQYNTVPKGTEFTQVTIPLTITGHFYDLTWPVFRRIRQGAEISQTDLYEAIPMKSVATDVAPLYPRIDGVKRGKAYSHGFFVDVTAGKKNDRFHYYFEVVDSTGAALATFTQPDGTPFMFRYIGHVPLAILITHVALIFATVFFISLGMVSSFSLVRGGFNVKPLAKYSFLAAVCAFLGCYPFGIPMNYYAFDGFWEGVPFGTDATDNKTQLLFVYLIFLTLATIGSLRGKPDRNFYSPKALGWFGIGSFAVMLFIYLIPHSIQFSPALTYSFCYSWIGVVALLYIYGRMKAARA